MSKEEYSNQTTVKAVHIDSSKSGELMQQKRVTVRGKGSEESRNETFDAIFTFDDALFCSESDIPLGGGYFLTDDGLAEVTQLIARFNSEAELNMWVNETLEISGAITT